MSATTADGRIPTGYNRPGARRLRDALNGGRVVWSAETGWTDDASLGCGHIWTDVRCPAYRTLDPSDCTCGGAS